MLLLTGRKIWNRLVLDRSIFEEADIPTIGAYEAKTKFSELINRVQRGERITITRYGEPVAVLSPVETAPPRPLQEIIEDVKAFRQGRQLGELSLRGMTEEGRT